MSERPTGLAALRDDERRREDADDWTEVEVEGRMSRGSEPLTLHASCPVIRVVHLPQTKSFGFMCSEVAENKTD